MTPSTDHTELDNNHAHSFGHIVHILGALESDHGWFHAALRLISR